jgi:hypothetical protein
MQPAPLRHNPPDWSEARTARGAGNKNRTRKALKVLRAALIPPPADQTTPVDRRHPPAFRSDAAARRAVFHPVIYITYLCATVRQHSVQIHVLSCGTARYQIHNLLIYRIYSAKTADGPSAPVVGIGAPVSPNRAAHRSKQPNSGLGCGNIRRFRRHIALHRAKRWVSHD